MPKRKTRRIDRGKPLRSLGKTIAKTAAEFSRASRPLLNKSIKMAKKEMKKYHIPRIENNGSWVDLRNAMNEEFYMRGIIESEDGFEISNYFQAAEDFLRKYKHVPITKGDIQKAISTVKADDVGSAMPQFMKKTFKKGANKSSIIDAFEYLFSNKISPIDMDESDDSGKNFKSVSEAQITKHIERQMVGPLQMIAKNIEENANLLDKNRSWGSNTIKLYKNLISSDLSKLNVMCQDLPDTPEYSLVNPIRKRIETLASKGREWCDDQFWNTFLKRGSKKI